LKTTASSCRMEKSIGRSTRSEQGSPSRQGSLAKHVEWLKQIIADTKAENAAMETRQARGELPSKAEVIRRLELSVSDAVQRGLVMDERVVAEVRMIVAMQGVR
jgi:hypothetical protein